MENKEDSTKFNQSENKKVREGDGYDLGFEPKQNIHLAQPECIGKSLNAGAHENKSYNCNKIDTQIDPLHEPTPTLVVKGGEIMDKPDSQNTSQRTLAGNKSGTGNENAKKNPDKNKGSKCEERQSLVFNSKDKGGKSVCGEGNSNILVSLREGVSDLTKGCEIIENSEIRENLPDKHLGSIFTTRGEDTIIVCHKDSADDGVRKYGSQSNLAPTSIKVMEGCKSCSHIYKGSSNQSTSNSETQTNSHVIRTTFTETNTSTHRTCSSQTAAIPGQRNNSAQTASVQATQECQASPVYITASSQTSLPKSDNIRKITIKPWSARKYNDLCVCAELGSPCTCAKRNASSLKMLLPRNSSWWPTVKKTLLIIAAIIPWVFLVVYAIYYYRINGNY